MKYIKTYESHIQRFTEIVTDITNVVFSLLEKHGFNCSIIQQEESFYNYTIITEVKLPDNDYKELMEDRFHKYDINNRIRDIIPCIKVDNFYNDSKKEGCVIMKFYLETYDFEFQKFILDYLPSLVNVLDMKEFKKYMKSSKELYDEYGYMFDMDDIGLM
jgi:hypothetical protein